jgi:hypothetical protein
LRASVGRGRGLAAPVTPGREHDQETMILIL